jgi:hypothetical protein
LEGGARANRAIRRCRIDSDRIVDVGAPRTTKVWTTERVEEHGGLLQTGQRLPGDTRKASNGRQNPIYGHGVDQAFYKVYCYSKQYRLPHPSATLRYVKEVIGRPGDVRMPI